MRANDSLGHLCTQGCGNQLDLPPGRESGTRTVAHVADALVARVAFRSFQLVARLASFAADHLALCEEWRQLEGASRSVACELNVCPTSVGRDTRRTCRRTPLPCVVAKQSPTHLPAEDLCSPCCTPGKSRPTCACTFCTGQQCRLLRARRTAGARQGHICTEIGR